VILIRYIAFVFILAQDTVGAELDDLLWRKVKAIIGVQTRKNQKRGSDQITMTGSVQSSEHHIIVKKKTVYLHVFVYITVSSGNTAIRAILLRIILGKSTISGLFSHVLAGIFVVGDSPFSIVETREHSFSILFHPLSFKVLQVLLTVAFAVNQVGDPVIYKHFRWSAKGHRPGSNEGRADGVPGEQREEEGGS
jgi:hypothetical protein